MTTAIVRNNIKRKNAAGIKTDCVLFVKSLPLGKEGGLA